jgi:hypothetical protein
VRREKYGLSGSAIILVVPIVFSTFEGSDGDHHTPRIPESSYF